MAAKKGWAAAIGAAVILAAGGVVTTYEGTVLHTYADPVGIPTACIGHTGPDVKFGQVFTLAECQAVLAKDLREHWARVAPCIRVPIAVHEGAAILSWSFNVGTDAACKSTLIRKLNEGAPPAVWCAELDKWVYSRGIKLGGLVKRRAAERDMCEGRTDVH